MYNRIVFELIFQIVFINLYVAATEQLTNSTVPNLNMDDWTTCEEFLANTTFDRRKVVDMDWQIFYFWNFEDEKSYTLRFKIPSPLVTDLFKRELQAELIPPVNWTEADMFMETSSDFSALYIRTEVSGQYRLIPSLPFRGNEDSIIKSVPHMLFALKYVEPGYLGIMNCKQRLCYALAPKDSMPKSEHFKREAEKIGFHSDHGRSYLVQTGSPHLPRPFYKEEDYGSDDDEDLDDQTFRGMDRESHETDEDYDE